MHYPGTPRRATACHFMKGCLLADDILSAVDLNLQRRQWPVSFAGTTRSDCLSRPCGRNPTRRDPRKSRTAPAGPTVVARGAAKRSPWLAGRLLFPPRKILPYGTPVGVRAPLRGVGALPQTPRFNASEPEHGEGDRSPWRAEAPAHVPASERALGLLLSRALSSRPTTHIVTPMRISSIMGSPPAPCRWPGTRSPAPHCN